MLVRRLGISVSATQNAPKETKSPAGRLKAMSGISQLSDWSLPEYTYTAYIRIPRLRKHSKVAFAAKSPAFRSEGSWDRAIKLYSCRTGMTSMPVVALTWSTTAAAGAASYDRTCEEIKPAANAWCVRTTPSNVVHTPR